jgi:hypothetical protein
MRRDAHTSATSSQFLSPVAVHFVDVLDEHWEQYFCFTALMDLLLAHTPGYAATGTSSPHNEGLVSLHSFVPARVNDFEMAMFRLLSSARMHTHSTALHTM